VRFERGLRPPGFISLLDWPEHNGTRVALFLGSMADLPTDNGIFVERDSYSEADAAVPFDLYVFFAEQGVQLIEHETDHQSGLLRLRRVGPVVTGYYRSDSDWVEMGSTNLGTQSLRFAVVTYSPRFRFCRCQCEGLV
jgi:hypothetical protein